VAFTVATLLVSAGTVTAQQQRRQRQTAGELLPDTDGSAAVSRRARTRNEETAPAALGNTTATARSATEIDVSWDDLSDNETGSR
jgi:hypothetical protein